MVLVGDLPWFWPSGGDLPWIRPLGGTYRGGGPPGGRGPRREQRWSCRTGPWSSTPALHRVGPGSRWSHIRSWEWQWWLRVGELSVTEFKEQSALQTGPNCSPNIINLNGAICRGTAGSHHYAYDRIYSLSDLGLLLNQVNGVEKGKKRLISFFYFYQMRKV